jgi:hypothetical protein
MRWRAVVVLRLAVDAPRDGELLEHQLRQSLAVRSQTAKIRHMDPAGTPRFAYLRIDGRTRTLQGAGAEVAGLARGLGVDLGARTDVVYWDAHPRGPRHLVRRAASRTAGGGGPSGGPGTAGVREPRRPYPPGFPPMQAAVEPSAD